MLKIRRPLGRLIFNMGIAIPGKTVFLIETPPWPHFYQTRSAWSVDQGSNKNHSPAYNFAPTVTKFRGMWEGLSLPHDTKFGNCRCEIVDSRSFSSWSLIHGLRWSGLIKVGPGERQRGCKWPTHQMSRVTDSTPDRNNYYSCKAHRNGRQRSTAEADIYDLALSRNCSANHEK